MADATGDSDATVEVISGLVPAILLALHALELAGRHLAPDTLPRLVEALARREDALGPALAASQAMTWPVQLAPARRCLETAAAAAAEGLAGLAAAPEAAQPMLAAYRALRAHAVAAQALYPMAPHLRPVSQFFLEPQARGDSDLLARLAKPQRDDLGVHHAGGPAGTRGGYSLYVPEFYDDTRSWPLVVGLHGGSGNGGAFLWSWLREARTRGAILVAPTAVGSTWSLMEPETDGANIERIVADVAGKWRVDPAHRLLTGMSDGGTFTYVHGLATGCRFSHLAPIAAAFHPLVMGMVDAGRVRGLPIHIVHGAQDWMFPAMTAQIAARTLETAGAAVVHREIADLSHTYPRDENAAILEWFLPRAG